MTGEDNLDEDSLYEDTDEVFTDSEDEEDFLSRACAHYMKYSVAESFVLRRNEENKDNNV